MSKMKNYYHEEISRGLHDDMVDDDYCVKEYEAGIEKEAFEKDVPNLIEKEKGREEGEEASFLTEEKLLEQWANERAEEERFFNCFHLTGTYPM